MQAEAQSKVDKKRDKQERKILDTQERAFWDVYRPPPGCINTTELDIKKVCKLQNSPPALDDLRYVNTVMLSQCYTPSKEKRRVLYFNHLSKEFLELMIPHLKALI